MVVDRVAVREIASLVLWSSARVVMALVAWAKAEGGAASSCMCWITDLIRL